MYELYMLKEINGKVERIKFDFYDVANALQASEQVKHTIKKLWRTKGSTGNKNRVADLKECINQLDKEIERITLLENFTNEQESTAFQSLKNVHHFDVRPVKGRTRILGKAKEFKKPELTTKTFKEHLAANREKRILNEVSIHDCQHWSNRYPLIGVYHTDVNRLADHPTKATDWNYALPLTGYRMSHDNSPMIETVRKWKNEVK